MRHSAPPLPVADGDGVANADPMLPEDYGRATPGKSDQNASGSSQTMAFPSSHCAGTMLKWKKLCRKVMRHAFKKREWSGLGNLLREMKDRGKVN